MAKKILIVDDSRMSRLILKGTLARIGEFEIIEAENGKVGVNKFRQHAPDITFMDLTMPIMDGFEAIEIIIEGDPNATIIVGTADIQCKSVERVRALGATEVVPKPFQVESVQKALDSACSGSDR